MRETILAAARAKLAEGGLSAVSMRGLAREIGYSPAALYEYFPSKAHLFQALFFEGASGLSGRIRAAMESVPPGTPAQQVTRAMGRAYRAYALENPELYMLVFSNPVPGFTPDELDRRHARDGFALLVEAMQSGIDNSDIEASDPFVAAMAAWSAVHGFVMLEITGYIRTGSYDSSDTLFDSLLDHIRGWSDPDPDDSHATST